MGHNYPRPSQTTDLSSPGKSRRQRPAPRRLASAALRPVQLRGSSFAKAWLTSSFGRARLLKISEIGRLLAPAYGHQKTLRAELVVLVSDLDVGRVLAADELRPLRLGLLGVAA